MAEREKGAFLRWLAKPEAMIGLCAVVVSVIAVFISAYKARIQRGWQRAAVWPFVQLSQSYFYDPEAEQRTGERRRVLTLNAENVGVGPALIKDFRVTVDEKPVTAWSEVVRLLTGMAARGFSLEGTALRAKTGVWAVIACASLAACSKSPVPSGVFLSLSVSAGDAAVETRINGEANDYLSGMSGSMVSSGPVNANLSEGANEISFTLSPGPDPGEASDPWFLAALEVSVKGEVVDTAHPGNRLIFQRELAEAEVQKLLAGEKLVLTETFSISRDELKAIKDSAEMAPKLEPAESTGH